MTVDVLGIIAYDTLIPHTDKPLDEDDVLFRFDNEKEHGKHNESSTMPLGGLSWEVVAAVSRDIHLLAAE